MSGFSIRRLLIELNEQDYGIIYKHICINVLLDFNEFFKGAISHAISASCISRTLISATRGTLNMFPSLFTRVLPIPLLYICQLIKLITGLYLLRFVLLFFSP